jgi:hypothetical protein
LSHPLNGSSADIESITYSLICPTPILVIDICFEQDTSMIDSRGGGFTCFG